MDGIHHPQMIGFLLGCRHYRTDLALYTAITCLIQQRLNTFLHLNPAISKCITEIMLCKNVFQKTNHAPIIPKSIVHDFGQSFQTYAVSACVFYILYTSIHIYTLFLFISKVVRTMIDIMQKMPELM